MPLNIFSTASETTKVIWCKDRARAVGHCWIHAPPILAIFFIAGLHHKGYYWGTTYWGSPQKDAQKTIELVLYVVAKLLEIFITASLAVTIRDFIRYFLLQDSKGVPLGILTADIGFSQIKYFSLKYWHAFSSFRTKKLGVPLLIWILFSGFMVTFVGPVTSFLVVPKRRDSWDAGAARFTVVGDSSILFPSTINLNSTPNEKCRSPSTENLRQPNSSLLDCPWAGFPTLFSTYSQMGSSLQIMSKDPITFYEWQTPRQILRDYREVDNGWELWAMGTMQAINAWSGSLHLAWTKAIDHKNVPFMANNFRRYNGNATVHVTNGMIPVVRAVCFRDEEMQNETNLSFPLIDPFMPYENKSFYLPKPQLGGNGSRIQWLGVPSTSVPTSKGISSNVRASALLIASIPQDDVIGVRNCTVTCTIDARWAPGSTIGHRPSHPVLDSTHLHVNSTTDPFARYVAGDNNSTLVTLSREWLNVLTPVVEVQGQNETMLSALLQACGLYKSPSRIRNGAELSRAYGLAGSAIASLITDGMSRIGVEKQVGNEVIEASTINDKHWKGFFDGDPKKPKYTYPKSHNDTLTGEDLLTSASGYTNLIWYVTIPGLSYKTDGLTGYLSLSLLYVYVSMALCHILCICIYGRYSSSWKTPEELIVLAKQSPNPAPTVAQAPTATTGAQKNLGNTSGGINSLATWSLHVRIREITSAQDKIHLLIDQHEKDEELVKADESY